jgi:hypothetical protein
LQLATNHGHSNKLLLVFSSAVIFGSKSQSTHDYILLSHNFGGHGFPVKQLALNCPLYKTLGWIAEKTASGNSSVVDLISLYVCICMPPIIARRWLSKHNPSATNTPAAIELLYMSSSM